MRMCSSNLMEMAFFMTPHSGIMFYAMVNHIVIAGSPNVLDAEMERKLFQWSNIIVIPF